MPDNLPHLHVEPGLIRINGLFRHGWMIAPALVEDALRQAGFECAETAAAHASPSEEFAS